MRRLVLAAVSTALLLAPGVAVAAGGGGGPDGRPWRPDLEAARDYARKQGGSVSFALRTRGALYGYRKAEPTVSASVVKAMLMVTYLNHETVRGRKLRRSDRELLVPMVRRSDNATASAVRDYVGNGALRHLARRVGMRRFATHPIWGLTQITAADQVRFFYAIDRYVVRRHREFAMRQLRSIVPRQRWGIARVRPPGWALYFKSGWVSGIENQVSLLRRGRRRIAIAVLTSGLGPAAGRRVERGVARRLLRGLGRDSTPR